jgi:hypothetical protein
MLGRILKMLGFVCVTAGAGAFVGSVGPDRTAPYPADRWPERPPLLSMGRPDMPPPVLGLGPGVILSPWRWL